MVAWDIASLSSHPLGTELLIRLETGRVIRRRQSQSGLKWPAPGVRRVAIPMPRPHSMYAANSQQWQWLLVAAVHSVVHPHVDGPGCDCVAPDHVWSRYLLGPLQRSFAVATGWSLCRRPRATCACGWPTWPQPWDCLLGQCEHTQGESFLNRQWDTCFCEGFFLGARRFYKNHFPGRGEKMSLLVMLAAAVPIWSVMNSCSDGGHMWSFWSSWASSGRY